VRLNLTNQGPDLTLGLSPLTFGQDLFVTVSGGPLSVGANPRSVTLERPDTPLLLASHFESVAATVPEPDSAWFFVSGGGLFYAISGVLKRFCAAGTEVDNRRNQVFAIREKTLILSYWQRTLPLKCRKSIQRSNQIN
jgi:hypothetical protein